MRTKHRCCDAGRSPYHASLPCDILAVRSCAMPDFRAGTRSKAYLARKRTTGRAKHEFLAGTIRAAKPARIDDATRCLVVAVLVIGLLLPGRAGAGRDCSRRTGLRGTLRVLPWRETQEHGRDTRSERAARRRARALRSDGDERQRPDAGLARHCQPGSTRRALGLHTLPRARLAKQQSGRRKVSAMHSRIADHGRSWQPPSLPARRQARIIAAKHERGNAPVREEAMADESIPRRRFLQGAGAVATALSTTLPAEAQPAPRHGTCGRSASGQRAAC